MRFIQSERAWEEIIQAYLRLRDPWHRRRVLCPRQLTLRRRLGFKPGGNVARRQFENRVEIIRLNSDLRPEGPELHVASPVYGTS